MNGLTIQEHFNVIHGDAPNENFLPHARLSRPDGSPVQHAILHIWMYLPAGARLKDSGNNYEYYINTHNGWNNPVVSSNTKSTFDFVAHPHGSAGAGLYRLKVSNFYMLAGSMRIRLWYKDSAGNYNFKGRTTIVLDDPDDGNSGGGQ